MLGGNTFSIYEVRIRAVEAVQRGLSRHHVASAYGLDHITLYRWIERFKESGYEGLLRKEGSGRPRLLEDVSVTDLKDIVLASAVSYGLESDLWTVGRLHQVIARRFQAEVSKNTVWRRLIEAGLTYQKPERAYYEADENIRKRWRRYEIPKIKRCVAEKRAILYFQDESNVSLSAFLGKTWAPCGKTPKAAVTGTRGGVSAVSAISGQGLLIFCLHDRRIVSDEVIEFLSQMLRHHSRRHLVVVMDRATSHTSQKTQKYIDGQQRLHIFYLPPYSPDWNLDEKV